jgi:tRNA pseudouridine13 synthase
MILCRFSDFQVNEIGKDGAVVHLRKIGLNGQYKPVSCLWLNVKINDADQLDRLRMPRQ